MNIDAHKLLYQVWSGMKDRCNNTNNPSYKWYGNRGISVCNEWLNNFEVFKQWALSNGYMPGQKLQIDRIDNNGNYEPNNCRFVDCRTNIRNSRCIRLSKKKVMQIRCIAALCNCTYTIIAKGLHLSKSTVQKILSNSDTYWSDIIPTDKDLRRFMNTQEYYRWI